MGRIKLLAILSLVQGLLFMPFTHTRSLNERYLNQRNEIYNDFYNEQKGGYRNDNEYGYNNDNKWRDGSNPRQFSIYGNGKQFEYNSGGKDRNHNNLGDVSFQYDIDAKFMEPFYVSRIKRDNDYKSTRNEHFENRQYLENVNYEEKRATSGGENDLRDALYVMTSNGYLVPYSTLERTSRSPIVLKNQYNFGNTNENIRRSQYVPRDVFQEKVNAYDNYFRSRRDADSVNLDEMTARSNTELDQDQLQSRGAVDDMTDGKSTRTLLTDKNTDMHTNTRREIFDGYYMDGLRARRHDDGYYNNNIRSRREETDGLDLVRSENEDDAIEARSEGTKDTKSNVVSLREDLDNGYIEHSKTRRDITDTDGMANGNYGDMADIVAQHRMMTAREDDGNLNDNNFASRRTNPDQITLGNIATRNEVDDLNDDLNYLQEKRDDYIFEDPRQFSDSDDSDKRDHIMAGNDQNMLEYTMPEPTNDKRNFIVPLNDVMDDEDMEMVQYLEQEF